MNSRSLFQDYCSLESADWSDAGVASPWEAAEFSCPFCGYGPEIYMDSPLDYLSRHPAVPSRDAYHRQNALALTHCCICGWWELRRGEMAPFFKPELSMGYRGRIHEFDISGNSVPMDPLMRHLADHWSDRKNISASTAEDIVCSILREHFEEVEYFSGSTFASDDGIDLVVGHRSGDLQIAVQVKRRVSKEAEPVSAVREFLGALAHSRFNKGIFVTTAQRFSAAAQRASVSPQLKARRLELELVDGERLLDILRYTVSKKALRLPPLIAEGAKWYHWDDTPHPTSAIIGSILSEEYSERFLREYKRGKLVQSLRSAVDLLGERREAGDLQGAFEAFAESCRLLVELEEAKKSR